MHFLAANYDSSKGFYLPYRRITGALKLDDLLAFGITTSDAKNETGFQHCFLPADWTPVGEESPWVIRFNDGQGRARLRIFYKPCAGTGSMEVLPRFTVALKTDDTLQWGEVMDGNTVIHRTATSLRSEGNLCPSGLNWASQPEYKAAAAWLAERVPTHDDRLAHWN